jgi:hypothetical protein
LAIKVGAEERLDDRNVGLFHNSSPVT